MSTNGDSQTAAGALASVVGKRLSALALGTAAYRPEEQDRRFRLIDDFLEYGGTVIDTGRQYGQSENVVGNWLASRSVRDEVVIVTKCGHGSHSLPENIDEVVTDELAESLDCLKTDYVDIYMLHRDNRSVPVSEVIDRLNVEVKRGRVRALGASNWSYDRVQSANDYAMMRGLAGFSIVSNNLSLAVPTEPFFKGLVSTDEAGERWHQETGIPLLSWSAQARGFFTGRFTPAMRDRVEEIEDSFTRRMVEVYCTEKNFERARRAQTLAATKGDCSAVQIALAWVLYRPFAVIPVVGPHTPEELSQCAEATRLSLTEAEIEWLGLRSEWELRGPTPREEKLSR